MRDREGRILVISGLLIFLAGVGLSSPAQAQLGSQITPDRRMERAKILPESPPAAPVMDEEPAPTPGPLPAPNRYLWSDVDNDGLQDLFVLDAAGSRLFHNLGDGSFKELTAIAFPNGIECGESAFFADYNGDKLVDLFLFHRKGFTLYRNEGNLSFSDTTEGLGLPSWLEDVQITLKDYDNDGFEDLLVQGPDGDRIYRNHEGRTFDEVVVFDPRTSLAGPETPVPPVAAPSGPSSPGAPPTGTGTMNTKFINDNSPGSIGEGIPEVEGGDDSSVSNDIVDGTITGSDIKDASLPAGKVIGTAACLTGSQNFDSGTLYINATTNRVGAGTASPNSQLEVRGATGLRVTDPDASNCYGEILPDFGSGLGGLVINSRTGGTFADISFQTNGATRMFLDSGGNLGIGTVAPNTPSAKLEVVDTSGNALKVTNSDSGNSTIYAVNETNGGTAVMGESGTALGNHGELGSNDGGVYGWGTYDDGLYGWGDQSGTYGSRCLGYYGRGLYAFSNYGDYSLYAAAQSPTYAGYFYGNVHVTGSLSKGSGSFVIDHPLDPESKLLRHNFVESPEDLLIYRGQVRLDSSGEAVVEMPDYFVALTKEDEATVSLTPIGRSSGENRYEFSYEWDRDYRRFFVYGEPDRQVSWLATADRDDPVIHQLRRPVEEEKTPDNPICKPGELLYPKAYGYPETASSHYKDIEFLRKEMDKKRERVEKQRQERLKNKTVETDG